MPANTVPIFSDKPDVSTNGTTGTGDPITLAAADYTGISANYVLEHTAGTNGSYIRRMRFNALGTNTATVARIFLNNGSVNTTAANNVMFDQVSLPATTASTTTATPTVIFTWEGALPAGWRVYVGLGTAPGAGWDVVTESGQY